MVDAQMVMTNEQWADTVNKWYLAQFAEIDQLMREGEEKEAASIIAFTFGNFGEWRSANVLLAFYKRFTNPAILYRCIIDTYTNDGYRFPKRIMMKAKNIAPAIDPAERFGDLAECDIVTVYRATNTPIGKVHNDLSWTTSKNVAIWFGYRCTERIAPLHIYTGTIERDKIIAFTNERNEFEVIQHGNVKGIVELHPTEEDILCAMEEHDKRDDNAFKMGINPA